jgi:hypothetical protein
MTGSRAALALAVAIGAACSTPTDSCACSRFLPFARVAGTAADSGGAAISDVIVAAKLSDTTCSHLGTRPTPFQPPGPSTCGCPLLTGPLGAEEHQAPSKVKNFSVVP